MMASDPSGDHEIPGPPDPGPASQQEDEISLDGVKIAFIDTHGDIGSSVAEKSEIDKENVAKKRKESEGPGLQVWQAGFGSGATVEESAASSSSGGMQSVAKESPKKLKFDWCQTEKVVVITVFVGIKLKADDMDVLFTDKDVQIKLADGRTWSCNFFQPILKEKSRVAFKSSAITLTVAKKTLEEWSSLQAAPKPPKSEKPKDEAQGQDVCKISHAKNQWYEKGQDVIVVNVYVKQVVKSTLLVNFEEKKLTISFQTGDSTFLKLYESSTASTKFSWTLDLRDAIVPKDCKYRLTQSLIEITMKKKEMKRWGALEASSAKEVAPTPSNTWMPASKGTEMKSSASSSKLSTNAEASIGKNDIGTTPPKRSASADWIPLGYKDTNIVENKENSQKPTCKVSPLNKTSATKLSVDSIVNPGTTGLDNLGNTCFMNSVLQVLANTRELRDYLLESHFQKEINTDNPLGTGGKLVVAFAVLLRVLWSGKHYSYAPSKLKNLISLKATQFTGFAQHDAQEFMAFLLDGLHEDINRVREKPYTETVDSDGRPDEVVAQEAWDVYKKRNNSFIVDLFQGQYKSKLVCPVCGKVSITFDPFLYLSVPLPKKQRTLPVIFVAKEHYKRPVRYYVRIPQDATVEHLKEEIHKKTGVKPNDQRVMEAYRSKIHKFFGKGVSLSRVTTDDVIFVFEVLSEELAGEPVYEIAVIQRTLLPNLIPTKCSYCKRVSTPNSDLRRCTHCLKVAYCDQSCQKQHWESHRLNCKNTPEPVGMPFIISIPESRATFSRLVQIMEAYARYSVDVFQPPVSPDSCGQQLGSKMPSAAPSSQSSPDSLDHQPTSFSQMTLDSGASQDPVCSEVTSCSSATEMEDLGSDNQKITEESQGREDEQGDSLNLETSSEDSGHATASFASGKSWQSFPTDEDKDVCSPVKDDVAPPSGEHSDAQSERKSVPTNIVLGTQQLTEKPQPLFYIRPVNQYGQGLVGPEGELLGDKGDEPLDLSDKTFLSIDWRNNGAKHGPSVMVQTKDITLDEEWAGPSGTEGTWDITLDHCLGLFTEPEVLSPEEAWYCPSCKEHREATKQMSIWRLPHTLIIQLKRFSFRNFIWRDKIDKMVEFPSRGLDLSKYFMGPRPTNEPAPIYDLYGVVNHYGGILGGHYTSFARCSDPVLWNANEVGWRQFDDSHVTMTSENNVVTRAAYLLFYRRRTPSFDPQLGIAPVTAMTAENQDKKSVEQTKKQASATIVKKGSGKTDTSGRKCEKSTRGDFREAGERGANEPDLFEEKRGVGDCLDNRTNYVSLGYTDMDVVD